MRLMSCQYLKIKLFLKIPVFPSLEKSDPVATVSMQMVHGHSRLAWGSRYPQQMTSEASRAAVVPCQRTPVMEVTCLVSEFVTSNVDHERENNRVGISTVSIGLIFDSPKDQIVYLLVKGPVALGKS